MITSSKMVYQSAHYKRCFISLNNFVKMNTNSRKKETLIKKESKNYKHKSTNLKVYFKVNRAS